MEQNSLNQQIKEEVTSEIRKYLEVNEKKKKNKHNKTYETEKAVYKGELYS